MDEAAIFTIHGWSSRMLKNHAFDSASLFQQSRVEDSARLRLTAVQDYWRKWFYAVPLDQLGALRSVGANPEELLKNLKAPWALMEKSPGVVLPVARDPLTLIREWGIWNQQLQTLETAARGSFPVEAVAMRDNANAAKLVEKGWTQAGD